jgi:hypothetical protein
MSHFLERLTYLTRRRESFADGHGELRDEDRMWEEGYRQRWQHDKIMRSTHGVNCTGSCSWKIYVKSGVVTWETQQTDYPRTRPGMPNHEPRGCSRGASYSWYLYSASRIKYPMVRGRLAKAWREARKTRAPVGAWVCLLKTRNCLESLAIFAPLPYRRWHDHNSVYRHFHPRLPVSSPRLPGTRAHWPAASSERPTTAAPRADSALLHGPTSLGLALPGLAAGPNMGLSMSSSFFRGSSFLDLGFVFGSLF